MTTSAGTWKPVPEFDQLYEVSISGEVRSKDRIDRIGRFRAGRVLRQNMASRGYLQVTLCDGTGSRRNVYVHRLVLGAFVGQCPEGQECLHANDDPTDNRLENLRWGTRSENRSDAMRNGRQYGGNMSSRTHCPSGHAYDEKNTYRYRRPTGQWNRQCRECHRDRSRRRRSEAK